MGIAALVIGIISLIIGLIPFCGMFAFLPALVGLGLAIADIVVNSQKGEPKGMGIAGLVLNSIAIIFIFIWVIILANWGSVDNSYETYSMFFY